MSTKKSSNAFKLTYSKSGDGSFFYSFAEDPPQKKEPAFALRLGTNVLKTAVRTYLIDKEIRNEVFSTTKNAHHMSLLTMNEKFKIIVNINLVRAVIKKFFPSKYLVLDMNHLKKVLWKVYTELYKIKDNIKVDTFFEEEMEKFEEALIFRECLKLMENDEFQLEENSVYPTYASNMPNACTQPSLGSRPRIVPDDALVSTHDIRPEYKYPQKSSKFCIYEDPPNEVDTDSLNITKKQEVETVDGKQAGKSQHGKRSVSQAKQSMDTHVYRTLKPFIVPDTNEESRKLPRRNNPRTSDKLSKAGKSQHGGNSVSQIMPNADTQPHLISKAYSLPDTRGQSRKLPGRKYPRKRDKLSSCKLTTMEVDTDFLNETKKQEVETVEGKQAGESQLGGSSVFQNMPNGDTQPHLIPKAISVPDTSGESRKQRDTKYPKTSDKFSSCKPTTMEVDTDFLNETKEPEVEIVEGKQADKSQLGGSSVAYNMPNTDTQFTSIPKPISVLGTSDESRKQPVKKDPQTSDLLSSCKQTKLGVHADSTEYDSTSEKELFSSESRVLLPLRVYSNRAKSNHVILDPISNPLIKPLPKNKSPEELLIPARNDEDIPINLPENGDSSPEISDDEIDSQHLLGFYDPQGHDIELVPLCCHSQPGGYMSYASQFLHIDGFDSSSDDDEKRKKSAS